MFRLVIVQYVSLCAFPMCLVTLQIFLNWAICLNYRIIKYCWFWNNTASKSSPHAIVLLFLTFKHTQFCHSINKFNHFETPQDDNSLQSRQPAPSDLVNICNQTFMWSFKCSDYHTIPQQLYVLQLFITKI